MSDNQQASKFTIYEDWTLYNECHVQYRVSINNVEANNYIVISKWKGINTKENVKYLPTSKQVYMKPQVFKNILEKGAEILKGLDEIEESRAPKLPFHCTNTPNPRMEIAYYRDREEWKKQILSEMKNFKFHKNS